MESNTYLKCLKLFWGSYLLPFVRSFLKMLNLPSQWKMETRWEVAANKVTKWLVNASTCTFRVVLEFSCKKKTSKYTLKHMLIKKCKWLTFIFTFLGTWPTGASGCERKPCGWLPGSIPKAFGCIHYRSVLASTSSLQEAASVFEEIKNTLKTDW